MSHPLDGVRAKLDRAREHLDAIDRDLDSFLIQDSDPATRWGWQIEHDFEKGEAVVRWLEHGDTRVWWALALGEFFYDVRSALDHLAWQLVKVSGNDPIIGVTEFPIFKDEPKFNERAGRKMAGIRDDIQTVIESLQPFRNWPEHPTHSTIWRIHDLCNIDKHRLLHLSDLRLYTMSVQFLFPIPEDQVPKIKKVYMSKPKRLKKNAVLARFRWDPQAMKALGDVQVQMKVQFTIDVALNEGDWVDDSGKPASQGMPIRRAMQVSLDYMNETLLPKFEEFFR